MALLAVKNLNFHIDEQPILREVSFSLEEGEFAVLTGPTGSGKSTLLRLIKKEIAPKGRKLGTIEVFGKRLSEISPEESLKIGYVMQRPENQIVTDKVYHELAFGLENLGLSREEIERKVGELASFFGIDSWFRKDTFALSGGEKQILALASVMAMDPRLLLLDEPTGELDPIASENFLSLLWKLNRELGVTVLLVEHRLDQVLE
ncbi:MAG TPA: ABC transporter ATP-binding protein, partial [Acholeplasmataceae bacterium]|nr:ABC transporter ATP-binding protein [Acholeplasmataceae bacterium]